MKTPIFIQKLFNKITKAKFYYVTLDISPDFNTGQGEMVSYTIRANTKEEAEDKAVKKAMTEWVLGPDSVYTVECVETTSPNLIYDR